MTFEEFAATRKFVSLGNLPECLADLDLPDEVTSVAVYADDLNIWLLNNGEFFLEINRDEWRSKHLEVLEHRLFGFYLELSGPRKNYTIVGRGYGDDEATVMVFNDCTQIAAEEAFFSNFKVSEQAKQYEGEDFRGAWVDAVIESESAMVEI